MDVYPGFTTVIAPFGEGQVMLQIDVSHRILRNDTAYDVMCGIYQSCQTDEEYQRKSMKALLGVTVMTKCVYSQLYFILNDNNIKKD